MVTACFLLVSCSGRNTGSSALSGFEVSEHIPLEHAEQFTADRLENGCTLVDISGEKYLIKPENSDVDTSAVKDMTIIELPIENVYCAASSAMDLIDSAGALDMVSMTSTQYNDWGLDNVRQAFDEDMLVYVGKYSAPDYEYILSENCPLAIESTMIYHSPQVKEKLEELGIPVLVERSSYESDPLARLEWIKLYGILFGKEAEAEKCCKENFDKIGDILTGEGTGKKAAFFYINSSGAVVVRKPDDYVAEMIRMAGGEYIFSREDLNAEENALSTMSIQMETFYEKAHDADILIYNSDIVGKVDSLSELVERYPILGDFKAVRENNLWCTEKNLFQQTTGAAEVIMELHDIFTDKDADDMEFLFRPEA
ncbi:MAG: Periplasmic binding protein [Firmicutes bacterium ADurb.BinA205]|nr:MAG: Periplasmic binding protein [Firmicutes bacterium ADurb.BinA205]